MTVTTTLPIQDSGLVIAVGTYDGVLAGWEFQSVVAGRSDDTFETSRKALKLTFATAVHEGSIRSLSIAGNVQISQPGQLLSSGFDESLKTHDWHKRVTCSGEIRTPSGFGTPVCTAFAPPTSHSTHCLVGFSNGKLCIYKKRDWSVQHVLAGHDGGVGAVAVHPSGKIALSGGIADGKLKLWDLTKGRLAFVNKIDPASTRGGKAKYDSVSSLVWSHDGQSYAYSHGPHITVREVASGKTLLDVDIPSRVNQVALMAGPEGLFVAAACNDGSLPVLAVEDTDDESRRAIMAIEPVDSHLAREERFKCIHIVRDYIVATANSAGVVSLMDLRGAVNIISSEQQSPNDRNEDEIDTDDGQDDDLVELAVNIIESVRLGTGARITCLTAWCKPVDCQIEEITEGSKVVANSPEKTKDNADVRRPGKRKQDEKNSDSFLNPEAMKKARSLVEKAKKMKMKREKNRTN